MLHTKEWKVARHLGAGLVGLEKESLRVTPDGYMAMTRDPFTDDPHIVRDFCENQTEINTPALSSVREAIDFLDQYTKKIRRTLAGLKEPELLWPFSNPPYIRRESDIPVAQYEGPEREKTEYRNYLAGRYGKYMMTFSGIHYNYSFSDELLQAEFEARQSAGELGKETGAGQSAAEPGGEASDRFRDFKNAFYVSLAAKALSYNWLIVAATAASPLLDCSYAEKGMWGSDIFNGMGSTRCSELGYWNFFTPVLDYRNIEAYAESILGYIRFGLIRSSSELYFPVRLKPAGKYDIAKLAESGVSHIELRMIDLNPLTPVGLDERDAGFIRLLLIYLAAQPDRDLDANEQIQAIRNTKNAARYDLKTVNIVVPGTDHSGQETMDAVSAALSVLDDMRRFCEELQRFYPGEEPRAFREAFDILEYQRLKFTDPDNRYAWRIRRGYSGGFVQKGLELARKYTEQDL